MNIYAYNSAMTKMNKAATDSLLPLHKLYCSVLGEEVAKAANNLKRKCEKEENHVTIRELQDEIIKLKKENGVRFTAKKVKMISPQKKVSLAKSIAGCHMADQIDADPIAQIKSAMPYYNVFAYINITAKLKTVCGL